MSNLHQNNIEFTVHGRFGLFTDPITKVGGEKCSYHIPTYEALKGIVKSIYWKPTIIWVIDEVRIMKPIRTQTKGTKPLKYVGGGNSLAIYTFLSDVEYQVRAHFEWNMYRPELKVDRNDNKHRSIAQRMIEKGGRQDIFLGTRDCQGYVESSQFGEGVGPYDSGGTVSYGLMFHGFDYPDESGKNELVARFWSPTLENGVLKFLPPADCVMRKVVRPMHPKTFSLAKNQRNVDKEEAEVRS